MADALQATNAQFDDAISESAGSLKKRQRKSDFPLEVTSTLTPCWRKRTSVWALGWRRLPQALRLNRNGSFWLPPVFTNGTHWLTSPFARGIDVAVTGLKDRCFLAWYSYHYPGEESGN
ncbi:hypothetical protein TNIN_72621 [Trichonephila inaurata madagascariensis]|uniref:Uncharacterized protein n=1 Tax=Trichonephila inaurata madagascariensis TaxID=2747483 RepID=A0A8X6X1Z1_9ARAC|nr:hypothetical protein TNIN_72621 [Trichonephila inaurata madagascariensis]